MLVLVDHSMNFKSVVAASSNLDLDYRHFIRSISFDLIITASFIAQVGMDWHVLVGNISLFYNLDLALNLYDLIINYKSDSQFDI